MPIRQERTPNPSAMKFTVGTPVGGPATHTAGDAAEPWIEQILSLEGVMSLFMTADFVTVTGSPDVNWESISEPIIDVLTDRFG